MTDSEFKAPAQQTRGPAWASAALLAAEWACVLAAVGLWSTERPPVGLVLLGLPLWLVAWFWRWLRLGRPTRATGLEWPILVFLLTAVVGVWAAPNRSEALARLDLFLGAAGIYYLLANTTRSGRQLFALGLGVVVAALAVYFATQHDWINGPAKFAIIGQVGRRLNGLTPQLHLYQPNANVVANLLALALPVSLVQTIAGLVGWQRAGWLRRLVVLVAGLSAIVTGAGLVMTESRASALGLVVAAGLAGWWWLAGRLGGNAGRRPLAIFGAGVALGLAGVVLFALAQPNLLTLALGSLPGPNSAISRTELFGQVWRMAQDTPFTGGGLAAFPGLYSTYILDVPNLFLTHAHNAFLNILAEQGWPGLLGFVAVLAAAVAVSLQRLRRPAPERDGLVAAGLLALAVLIVQGLGDGTLVASRVALAWLIPAGLAVDAPDSPRQRGPQPATASATRTRPLSGWLPWLAGLAVVGVLALVTWQSWLAAWYADLGSVAFARIQLEGWPTNEWSTGQEAPRLAAFAPLFEHALALNPANETALYRLGLLAGLQRDYPAAVQRLAPAHLADPNHRGINKNLAYAYIWVGDFQDAGPLLKRVPEAANELSVYIWWWGTQGQPLLAQRAAAASHDLATAP